MNLKTEAEASCAVDTNTKANICPTNVTWETKENGQAQSDVSCIHVFLEK